MFGRCKSHNVDCPSSVDCSSINHGHKADSSIRTPRRDETISNKKLFSTEEVCRPLVDAEPATKVKKKRRHQRREEGLNPVMSLEVCLTMISTQLSQDPLVISLYVVN